MELGTLIEMSLKDLWPGEATHFTPWLAKNLSLLSERLDMELELETTEADAGDFSADIVASDLSTNRRVIIENQYGPSDHRHLGQILTYSSVLNASAIIWIAETVRQEHRTAIDFLNQHLRQGLQLYALEAKLIRIDSSKPAFRLDVICAPPELQSPDSPADSDTRERYRLYYQALLDELRTKHNFTNARAGQPQNWYTFASEASKIFKYSTSFAHGGKVRAEVYIDTGDKQKNEALFDWLHSHQIEIEIKFGSALNWEKLEGKRACRIAIYRDGEIDAETEVLAEIRAWVVENLLKLKQTFPPYIIEGSRELGLSP